MYLSTIYLSIHLSIYLSIYHLFALLFIIYHPRVFLCLENYTQVCHFTTYMLVSPNQWRSCSSQLIFLLLSFHVFSFYAVIVQGAIEAFDHYLNARLIILQDVISLKKAVIIYLKYFSASPQLYLSLLLLYR